MFIGRGKMSSLTLQLYSWYLQLLFNKEKSLFVVVVVVVVFTLKVYRF